MRAQGGFGEAEARKAVDWPVPDLDVLYLWEHWRVIHRERQSGGMAPNPICSQHIEAYCRLYDVQFLPWEARAIRAIDDEFIASLSEVVGEGASDG